MNDLDRWGEECKAPLVHPRHEGWFNSILIAAMVLIAAGVLFPFGYGLYLALTKPWHFLGGDKCAKVTGTVTYNGQPLSDARICILGAEGTELSIADIMDDGTYVVQAAPVGEVVICFREDGRPPFTICGKSPDANARDLTPFDSAITKTVMIVSVAGSAADQPPTGHFSAIPLLLIPEPKRKSIPQKYCSAEASVLKFKVKKGKNVINIDLAD